jgi:hypothetical protein
LDTWLQYHVKVNSISFGSHLELEPGNAITRWNPSPQVALICADTSMGAGGRPEVDYGCLW